MYEFVISVASDMNVMKKVLVLACSLQVDFNYLDKRSITIWRTTNESNIETWYSVTVNIIRLNILITMAQ
jgi:hypothetical protein